MSIQDSIRMVNISADLCALALMLVLFVGLLADAMQKKRRLLLLCMLLHVISVTGFLLKGLFEHGNGAFAHVAVVTGTYLSMFFAIFTSMAITVYVYTNASAELFYNPRTDSLAVLLFLVFLINMLTVVVNPFTHTCFVVDEHNDLIWSPMSWVNNVLLLFQSVLIVPIVLRLNGFHDRLTNVRLLLSGLTIIIGSSLNVAFPSFDCLPMAGSLVFTLLAVGVQARLEEELAQARTEVAESRVRLLSGQIHPHFIFNSLNAIKALVIEDPVLAERTIQDFSDYLRSHLDVMSSLRLVPFEQEMEHVRHYVSLEMADPVVPLEVTYDLQATDFLIPPLTVQPLVENAIRHGVMTREGGGRVLVESHATDEAILVSVTDDGQGMSSVTQRQTERQRVGIDNVRERIERQCAGTLEVTSGQTGTVAMLTLPRSDGQ